LYRFIEPGRSIFLGGLVRIDYIEGPPAVFSFYVANTLPIHLTKMEKADTVSTVECEERVGGREGVQMVEESKNNI
jgi:hypothetical protein